MLKWSTFVIRVRDVWSKVYWQKLSHGFYPEIFCGFIINNALNIKHRWLSLKFGTKQWQFWWKKQQLKSDNTWAYSEQATNAQIISMNLFKVFPFPLALKSQKLKRVTKNELEQMQTLTHLFPMQLFSNPWKHQKTVRVTKNELEQMQTLTHLFPMQLFSNPWKHQKTVRFSDVFRG